MLATHLRQQGPDGVARHQRTLSETPPLQRPPWLLPLWGQILYTQVDVDHFSLSATTFRSEAPGKLREANPLWIASLIYW